MLKAPPVKRRQPLNVAVTLECKRLIVELASFYGTSQTAVIERAVRELAERHALAHPERNP